MKLGELATVRLWSTGVCLVVLIAAMALSAGPAEATAPSPVLEFASPTNAFPIPFSVDGGEVTAALSDFETVVHCADSEGTGQITGPRSTVSNYIFTGCKTQSGSEGGSACKSEGADAEEIKTPNIVGDLVFIDQATGAVGILLDPDGGTYMAFECGGQSVKALGPFLSPVGPINQETTSFSASLYRSGASQTPSEYEGPNGERLPAIPTGVKGTDPPTGTGVELSFAIHPAAPLTVRAVTSGEIEAKQREDEAAAAAQKRQGEEAANAAIAKKHQEEDAARTAAKKAEEELVKAKQRTRHLSKALRQCKKVKSKQRRTACEKRAKKRYGAHSAPKKPQG